LAAHVADDIAATHVLAGGDVNGGEVPVNGMDTMAVGERPQFVRFGIRASFDNSERGRRMDTSCCSQIDIEPTAEDGRPRQRLQEVKLDLDRLNLLRRDLVRTHFDQLCAAMVEETPAAVVLFCEHAPKGIAGLLASKCVERFGVPSILLVPSGVPGIAVGSGRSVPGFDLEQQLQSLAPLFDMFGGHAQAVGITLRVDRIGDLRSALESACRGLALRREPQADGNLLLCSLSASFYAQLWQLELLGKGIERRSFVSRAQKWPQSRIAGYGSVRDGIRWRPSVGKWT
jgi:single-stranded DNA-specific DHH superfamily exonuclease